MNAQLDRIRFEMEEARREAEIARQRTEQLARQERRRFIVQTIVTSIAEVTMILCLMVKA